MFLDPIKRKDYISHSGQRSKSGGRSSLLLSAIPVSDLRAQILVYT